MSACTSEALEVRLYLLGHQHASLLQELTVVGNTAVQHVVWQAAAAQVGAHLCHVGDAAILPRTTIALLRKLGEVSLRRIAPDGDVDLALREHEVCDLIVAAARETLTLEMAARIDVMHIAPIQQEIMNGDVAGQEARVSELHLRRLIDEEVRAGRGRGIHLLRQQRCPEALRQLGFNDRLTIAGKSLGVDLAYVEVEGGFRASRIASTKQ